MIFFTTAAQPSVEIFGITITDPITSLTGLMIAGICGVFCYKMRHINFKDPILVYMFSFQALLGLSSFFGALFGHAFQHNLGVVWKIPGWQLGMYAAFCIAQATLLRLYGNKENDRYRKITRINTLLLCLCAVMNLIQLKLAWVEVYTAIGLVGMMVTGEYMMFKKGEQKISRLMMSAVIPMLFAVTFHLLKCSISIWFNYFDIAHIFMCATAWYFYKAAQQQASITEPNSVHSDMIYSPTQL